MSEKFLMIPFAGRTTYSYAFPVYKCDKTKLNSILQLNLNAACFFPFFFFSRKDASGKASIFQ